MARIATVCMKAEFDVARNLSVMEKYMREAASQGAQLIVFPEAIVQGYLSSLGCVTGDVFAYQHENAELIPDGPSTQHMIALAKELKMYVVFGISERSEEDHYTLYNSAVLAGPEGYIGKYRKAHHPAGEKHVFWSGTEYPVFDTELGKIGMLICYDKMFPEPSRIMAMKGAEILIMPTAWSVIDETVPPETEAMKIYYDIFDKARAVENQCWFICSNQVGKTGEAVYFGCSRITAPDGRYVADTGCAEGMVIADVDIKKEIRYSRTELFSGLNFLKDRNKIADVIQ